ncbi:MAG: tRNA (adenosine(37)-N6)-threonylcarbamoyltransferase complex transferase subunit TsaD, partial [Pseudomonadota bacterium]
VSGGHCQFLSVKALGDYQRLGSTIDDAAGEAFDKTAKLLGLGSPGGPAVERAAQQGDPGAVPLPRPLLDRPNLDMSFAGLKTAILRAVEAEPLTETRRADICASFQAAVSDVLGVRTRQAMKVFAGGVDPQNGLRVVVAGGVAANAHLRARLQDEAQAAGFEFIAPPLRWCTDNAAMIALAGAERLSQGPGDALDSPARSRWPLDERSAAERPVSGGGKRGAKV